MKHDVQSRSLRLAPSRRRSIDDGGVRRGGAVYTAGMPAVYTAPPRKTPPSSIDLRLEGASRNERLCTSCFIIRPRSEFREDSETCRVCE